MKKLILIIFTFLIWSQKPAISGEVAMIGVVDGMICLECQKKVTTELKAATGENDIGVSWQEGVAFINFSGSTTFSEKDFKKVIENAGFKVGKVAKIDEKIIDSKTGLITLNKF
jgi:copper chaperone CopZ